MNIEVVRYRTKFEADLVAGRVNRSGITAAVERREDGWVVATAREDMNDAYEVIEEYAASVSEDVSLSPHRRTYGWVVIATSVIIPVLVVTFVLMYFPF